MWKRTVNTSENLKKKFHNIYQDFYLKHDLVLSTPHLFNRGHAFSKVFCNTKIKQKLPNNMFLGVNFINSPYVNLYNIKYFSQYHQEFLANDPKFTIEKLDLITKLFKEKLRTLGYKKGISMNILSEYPRGYGANFMSGFLITLSAVLIVISDKEACSHSKDLNYIFKLHQNRLLEYYLAFNKIIYPDQNIKITGTSLFTSMGKSFMPYSQYKKKQGSLLDLFSTDYALKSFPFDYGIISYGLGYSTNYLVKNQDIHPGVLGDVDENKTTLLQLKKTPHFAKHIFSTISESLQKKLLQSLIKVLNNPVSDQVQTNFFDILAEHGYYHCFLEKEHKLFSDTYFLFSKAKIFDGERIVLIPLSSAKTGGAFLFVTQSQKSRDSIKKLHKLLRKNSYPKVCYQYLSREDGNNSDILQIQQYISGKIYSPYIKPDNVVFQDFLGRNYVGKRRSIIEKEKQYLLLDMISKKIYYNGLQLTHKDLRSQSGTVEIMDILLENIGSYVTNKYFPSSSYSKSKNEMMGKIISPLQDLSKKYFKNKFSIKCSGSLHDFDLILEDIPQNIGLIKKVNMSI